MTTERQRALYGAYQALYAALGRFALEMFRADEVDDAAWVINLQTLVERHGRAHIASAQQDLPGAARVPLTAEQPAQNGDPISEALGGSATQNDGVAELLSKISRAIAEVDGYAARGTQQNEVARKFLIDARRLATESTRELAERRYEAACIVMGAKP